MVHKINVHFRAIMNFKDAMQKVYFSYELMSAVTHQLEQEGSFK